MRRAAWLAWLLVAAALAPQIARLDRASTLAAPDGSASLTVAARLRSDFDGRHGAPLLLVMRGLPAGLSDDSARTVLRRLLAPIASGDVVHTILSPATSLDTLFWSADRRSAMALVEYVGDERSALRILRARSAAVVADARSGRTMPALPSLTMRWTGEPALLADLKDVAARELRGSEWRALPITVLVAWWAFGTVLEALLATGVAALVVVTALGIVGGLSAWWPASPLTASVVSLTGLALSIDYQLIVRRARDSGNSAAEARRLVSWAALLVAAAFIVLTLLPTGEVRSAAFAGAITTLLAALAAFARSGTPATAAGERSHTPFAVRGRWRAWGSQVTRHAWPSLLASSAVMLWLAWPVTRLRLVSPADALLPRSAESMEAIDDLATFGRAAVPLTLTVLVDLPRGVSVFDERGWTLIQQAVAHLRALTGVARVDGITTLGTGERIVAQYAIPDEVRSALVSRTRQSARLTVWTTSSSLSDVQDVAERIRTALAQQVPIAGVVVSGLPVLVREVADRVRDVIPLVVGGTMLVSLLVLTWRFRAPLLALKAVLANAVVAAAAMGLVVRVFQDGAGLLSPGPAALGGIFPTVPLLVFTATFGMSMDYELMLLSAVERATHRDPLGSVANAVAVAMADVGGLIWRAAALTGAVCGAFALSTFSPLAMIGLALCSAVLLDASIVRLVLVPAWLTIAGRWNWWPNRLRVEPSEG